MTEIIDRPVQSEIGTVRKASELRRGYHVRLTDGRWVLLLEDPSGALGTGGSGRLAASVSVQMRHTEGASWRPGEHVFSRSPEEQIRHVESVFGELKVDATAASILRQVGGSR